jgi:AcrR family transcriptional regulator
LSGYSQEADRHFQLISAAAEVPDWWEQLRGAVRAYVHELERNPRFAKSFLIEILAAGPRALGLRSVVHERYAALIKDWYERAPEALHLPPLPDEIYRAAVGATNELVVARFEREDRGDRQPLDELVLYSLIALFGLSERARKALRPKQPAPQRGRSHR